MRGGRGGKAGVVAASALLTFTFAAPPLLSSSATSAALQTSLAQACPADVGLVLDVERAWLPDLAAAARSIGHTGTPVVTGVGATRIVGEDGSAAAVLLARDAAAEHLPGGSVTPASGTVLVPAGYADASGLGAGDALTLLGGAREESVAVSGTYPDIPVRPEPAAWCGVRELLRSNATGATPLLITDAAVVGAAADQPVTLWELDPVVDHLTVDRAETLHRELVQLADGVTRRGTSTSLVPDRIAPDLPSIIEAARDHGDIVTGGMIGPRLVAFAMAVALLVAATCLLVRQSRGELTLRAVRGETAAGLGVRVAERAALPALVGSVVGAAGSFLAVRNLGPAADIESSAVRRSLLLAAVSLLLTIVVVAVSGARRADQLVDRPVAPRRRAVWPWELVPVVIAVAGLFRLDHLGGLQVAGAPAVATDALAQAFPVFAIAAVAAVLSRLLTWVYRGARHGAHRLGPATLLGWRRLGADARVHALVTGVAVLAVGSSVVAGSVARSADRAVADKSAVFLGADLRAVTADDPVIPASMTGTPVSRASARSGDLAVTVLGIDPDTFASVVRWDAAASERPLAELLDVLQVDDMEGAPLPAVLVGGRLTDPVFTSDGEPVGVDLNIIATADWFPGKTGEPLIVVNRNALAADEVPTATEVWLRDPPPDAVDALAAAGNTVRGSQTADGVFDPAGTAALRWSAGVLIALAVFAVVAALVTALVLLCWRLPGRRAGWAVRPPIGEPRREEVPAALVALGVPVVIGIAAGALTGWAVARLAVARLDLVDTMAPRASFALDLAPPAIVSLALLAVVVVAAIATASTTGRSDPVEVSRDGIGS